MSARTIGIAMLIACIVGAAFNFYIAAFVGGPWKFLNAVAAGMCIMSGFVMAYSLWRNWRWL